MNQNKQKIVFGKISTKSINAKKIDEENGVEITSGFGTFGDDKSKIDDNVDEVNEQINKVMGFTDFGQKKAKKFDVREMLKLALDNKDNIIPPKPENQEEESDDDDEGEIGPSIPEEYLKQNSDSVTDNVKKKSDSNNADR